jgi:segregation and condensation protein B
MLKLSHRRIIVELSVDQIKRIVEASLLMNREPQQAKKLAELFTPEENINERAIVDTLTLLTEDYRGRGVELVEVASGYRFQVCADLAPWISRTMTERPQRYSRALLETLALIAYRQPITRAEIEEIRGVVVSTQIMRTLEEREWVRVIGHRDVPGRPALYATTKQFLNDLNLKSLGELPTLAELQDLDKIDGEFQQLNLDISNAQESSPQNTDAVSLEDVSAMSGKEGEQSDLRLSENIAVLVAKEDQETLAESVAELDEAALMAEEEALDDEVMSHFSDHEEEALSAEDELGDVEEEAMSAGDELSSVEEEITVEETIIMHEQTFRENEHHEIEMIESEYDLELTETESE